MCPSHIFMLYNIYIFLHSFCLNISETFSMMAVYTVLQYSNIHLASRAMMQDTFIVCYWSNWLLKVLSWKKILLLYFGD